MKKKIKDFKVIFEALEPLYDDILSGKNGIYSKRSPGSTHPNEVAKFIKHEEKWLKTAYLTI